MIFGFSDSSNVFIAGMSGSLSPADMSNPAEPRLIGSVTKSAGAACQNAASAMRFASGDTGDSICSFVK